MMLPAKYFSNDEVAQIISVPECIEVVEDLFKNIEQTQMPHKVYMDIPNGDFRSMPAIVKNTAGIKWCGVHLDETGTKRKINIFAKVLINDVDSGKLLAILDGETLTAIRTAAVTGVATKYLSPKYSTKAAFIGCGNQTLRQIEAVLTVRDLEVVRLFDLSEERANKLKDELNYLEVRQGSPVEIEVHNDLENCLWDADIVTTLTPSRQPFIKHRYLKPVVHINKKKFEKSLGRKVTPKMMRKYALGESLHNLKKVEPETYYDLRVAALSNPDYRKWVTDSYNDHAKPGGETRDLDQWEVESRFDQIVSGFMFAGDPDFPTMEDWNAYDMPYSGAFRDKLNTLKSRMFPKPGVINPYVEDKRREFF